MNKFIFADSLAIKNQGIKSLKSSEKWPVAEEEFQEFSRYIFRKYEELMFKLDDNLFDIALIDYKFPTTLLQIFHYNYMKNYAHKNNIDILSGGNSQSYLHPDWDEISKQYSLFKPPHNKLIRITRRIIKNTVFNGHLGIHKVIRNLFSSSNFISVGSNSGLKRDYVSKNSIYSDHQDVYDILNFRTDKKELVSRYHQEIMDSLISPYLKILKSHQSMFLDGINISDIESCWSNRLKDMIPAYINILDSNNKNKFLVTDVASIMHRILVVGYQRIGCQVLGFHHGGDFAATILNQMHKSAMSHCKNIVVPTNGIANQYKKKYSCLKLEMRTGTRYYPVNSSKSLYNDKIMTKSKRKIKTVMLIGFPMNCQKKTDERGLFFLPKVHIEYDVSTMLKKWGVSVLYKAHPDRKDEVSGIFTDVVDEVVCDPFESSWERADAFIFTHTSTTTFSFALATDRKVILIDVDTNLVDKELREKLSKRVDCVPATIDSNDTMIQFDEKKLKEYLL